MKDLFGLKRKKYVAKYRSGQNAQVILSGGASFAYAEAYKTLRTNLEFVCATGDVHSLVVTSALPEESKSTTAINLAITLAAGGRSVVVVGCDLRKPVLHKYLKLKRGVKGLSAILAGSAQLEECIIQVEGLGISVIGSGSIPPNPSELLDHERMQQTIRALEQAFDYVILDAPPVTLVTDAAVLSRMVDGVLLVVRSKYAQTKTVKLAKQRLDAVGAKVLGAVITRFDPKRSGWRSGYDYEGYNYGYGRSEKQS